MSEWTCDVCGGPIKSAKDGWVEWLFQHGEAEKEYGLRLVHHRPASPRADGCQYDGRLEYARSKSSVKDLDLEFFSSADGLMHLLEMVSQDRFEDREEILQMIKRLHVPGYEKAHRHLEAAVAEEVFEPNSPPNYPFQHQIQLTNEWLDSQR
ncbi:hypothetical protein [Modicisalibacter xianhensis]|uniref:hypothetical protein n=1 Tax=Modicisalibacter xianhensis TaxID=442341 RepID=UPI001C43481B|nr:hypothetical protein [Halomonas xianhensis]